jgi:hypothetical protein
LVETNDSDTEDLDGAPIEEIKIKEEYLPTVPA